MSPAQPKDNESVTPAMTRRNREKQFLEHLPVIERAISFASKRSGFSPEDTEEFASWVKVKLIDGDYAILRKFEARCHFSTFLNVVILRLAGDYRDHLWGRYRASAAAKRLGEIAIQLERLLTRDGYTVDEAIRHLRSNHGVIESAEALRELAARLPLRQRRQEVGEAALVGVVGEDGAEERALAGERGRVVIEVRRVLALALASLPAEDLLLLKLYYKEGYSIPAIARRWNTEPRPLFRRRTQALDRLRGVFQREGLAWDDVRSTIGWDSPLDDAGENGTINEELDDGRERGWIQ